jgi:hypothetical protein
VRALLFGLVRPRSSGELTREPTIGVVDNLAQIRTRHLGEPRISVIALPTAPA